MLGLTLKVGIYISEWKIISDSYHSKSRLAYVSRHFWNSSYRCLLRHCHCIMASSAFSKSPLISACQSITALSHLPKLPFILVCQSITALSHLSYRRLFWLAYVLRHHRYYHITVYFGYAIVSRHRYSSHTIEYRVTVDYIGLTIYLGYLAIPVSDVSWHLYLDSMSRKVSRLAEYRSLRRVSA